MILENNIKQNLLNNNDQKGNHDYDNVNNHQTIQLCCYSRNNDNNIYYLYKLLIKQLKSRTFIVGYVHLLIHHVMVYYFLFYGHYVSI